MASDIALQHDCPHSPGLPTPTLLLLHCDIHSSLLTHASHLSRPTIISTSSFESFLATLTFSPLRKATVRPLDKINRVIHSVFRRRERREGFGRELSRHGRRSPKGQQLRLGSPQTRVCKRALALRPKLRGGARKAQAQCAAEVATREIRRKERGLPAGLREGHCAPPPWLPPPRGSSGRPHVPPCPGSSPSLPLPGSGRGLLSSPPAEMALDPAEQHLRHVEKDVLIPKIMREKARERCSEQVQDISKTPEKVHLSDIKEERGGKPIILFRSKSYKYILPNVARTLESLW
ncbi:COX assembly mitochondrial protein homolog [Herpailurus yagouaroundi]|uniref:COX assembly mitochondrial protein homolog n=1 Tax=Herpailurus yagouaroundi TaxID=1608482 RepID=UPI001AD75044|nr:COX assembly mitochondrial protein homolog [Puma yagouaroundi]